MRMYRFPHCYSLTDMQSYDNTTTVTPHIVANCLLDSNGLGQVTWTVNLTEPQTMCHTMLSNC